MIDLSQATIDELRAEVQKRTTVDAFKDGLHTTIMEARNKGIKRGEAMQAVVEVLNVYYGGNPNVSA